MILPALLLTLDKYSSWRVGRVVPMIRSAVRTTLHSRGLHGGPGTRTGSGLYFKWSVGSGSGPNLLLRVPGLFNFVCNTRVHRRTPHPRVISVSQHACV